MDGFKKVMGQIGEQAVVIEENLGIIDIPDEEIYAPDPELREAVGAAKKLIKECQLLVSTVEQYVRYVKVTAQKEQDAAKKISPNSALEQVLPQSTVIALVSIASFQVSSSTRMEKYAMDLAAETVKEFQGMKDRYRKGIKIYEQSYRSLRKEAVKLQKKALRSSSDGQSDEIKAKLDAAEPVWRAKGESLRAEADALVKLLEDFNLRMTERIVSGRPPIISGTLEDLEEILKNNPELGEETAKTSEAAGSGEKSGS
mmetsp:Transcript_23830/g.34244  ORF Transcript_23830/g.34244 Transcript_23830/m.34244 type:complete len:257 (-) Transcript_23830:838-1608(-)